MLLVLLAGCAAQPAQPTPKQQANALLDSWRGTATKEQIAVKLGIPNQVQPMNGGELWQYRWSGGTRTIAAPIAGIAVARSYERYLELVLFFDGKGIMRDGHFIEH